MNSWESALAFVFQGSEGNPPYAGWLTPTRAVFGHIPPLLPSGLANFYPSEGNLFFLKRYRDQWKLGLEHSLNYIDEAAYERHVTVCLVEIRGERAQHRGGDFIHTFPLSF
jgi:hypothetical protein